MEMNLDEYLDLCRKTIGKPNRRLQICPNEKQMGGPNFKRLADIARFWPWNESPFLEVTFEVLRAVEKELGRSLINSGDVLFDNMLVGASYRDESLDWMFGDFAIIDLRYLDPIEIKMDKLIDEIQPIPFTDADREQREAFDRMDKEVADSFAAFNLPAELLRPETDDQQKDKK